MATNEEIFQRIIKRIEERTAGRDFRCAICDHNTWNVPPEYIYAFLTRDPRHPVIGGPAFILVPVVCTNCGNTHLLNIGVLGLAEDLESIAYSEEKKPEDAKQ